MCVHCEVEQQVRSDALSDRNTKRMGHAGRSQNRRRRHRGEALCALLCTVDAADRLPRRVMVSSALLAGRRRAVAQCHALGCGLLSASRVLVERVSLQACVGAPQRPVRGPYYWVESTVRPYWAKCRSKVKAAGIRSLSITAKLAASVREKSLSVYW